MKYIVYNRLGKIYNGLKSWAQQDNEQTNNKSYIWKTKRILIGTFFIILGFIGIILPIMPSVVFFILALACYGVNIKKRFYTFVNSRFVKKHIRKLSEVAYISRFFNKNVNYIIENLEEALNTAGLAETENQNIATLENTNMKIIANNVNRITQK